VSYNVTLRRIRDWYALRRFSLPAFGTWALHICIRFRQNSRIRRDSWIMQFIFETNCTT